MMSMKMGEKPRPGSRHALRNYMLLSIAGGVALVAALIGLNQNPTGQPMSFSPLAGLLILAIGLVTFVLATMRYVKRTDEHDLMANLWGLSLGWLAMVVMGASWWVLHHSGLAGPVDSWPILITSSLVAGAGWAWLRFR